MHPVYVARMSSSSAGGESATYFTEPPDFHISPRALHSQECFLPLRGGFNLRCTRVRYIPKNVFFLCEEVLIYDAPSLRRKNVLFLRWRGERYILHRATGFPYIS